jgi:hypothetical protein
MGSTIVVDDGDAGAGGTATAAQHTGPQQSFHAYARVLRSHRNFRYLWIGGPFLFCVFASFTLHCSLAFSFVSPRTFTSCLNHSGMQPRWWTMSEHGW